MQVSLNNSIQNQNSFGNDYYKKRQHKKIALGIATSVGLLHGVYRETSETLAPARILVKNIGYEKILNPADEKVFNLIDKAPGGKSLTKFLNKSDSKIRHIFGKYHCDFTLMAKGAGFMAGTCLLTMAVINGVKKIFNS